MTAWGALALHFAGPRPASLANALAGAWVVVAVAIFALVRPPRRALVAFAVAFAALLVWWSTVRPSNDRDWYPDVARLPRGEVHGDIVTIENVRNFDYRSETDYTPHWETRTLDLSKLEGLDLFLSYWGSPAIAHTILSWSFSDGQHLAISIETRKERGEEYSAIAGFFRQYELYYVVADERDLVGLRTNQRGEGVYLYLLRTPRERARRMLLDYVAGMNELAREPSFYNAATQNCTTTIRTHVIQIGVAMPWDWRILVNGYIDQLLYEQGVIDTSRPFGEVRERSLINPRAKADGGSPNFSARIREGLTRPPPRPK
ncbi:MAG TPA: DUF4105 domain-containing protein [Candidatus Binatia bacterium]|nr:DUF4105 domain-containing protein [Candidatus Binatia bacterium]